ncbi:elongator complex protein 4 [Delitschia confertaspora ATCC 74209]|uniref:Elongator complex protein 4 n=1 Tax=Delitschia confertaspora ATCC 74209 TaxID=1513339 RepID=A0A9P4MP11_9PLEO|nr:elongator complex protein 4 [Delitschia confertaspora ATCC 74209]
MAFRKRNVVLSRPGEDPAPASPSTTPPPAQLPSGVRPSSVDGRPITSTGTPSFDSILAGHAGLPLGTSVLIEENGTTDYAGALLKFYAAEGVVQGHKVHVVGMGEAWGRGLPGVATDKHDREDKAAGQKMKIAWRYEGLGQFDGSRGSPTPNRGPLPSGSDPSQIGSSGPQLFCHTFDLAKRLTLPVGSAMSFYPIPLQANASPFVAILRNIQQQISTSPPATIHRIVIPSLLSPAIYPPISSHPHFILQFLHGLRALLRQYSTNLTVLITLPTELYPRTSGLVRWMEIINDGVLELTPFPHHVDTLSASGAATTGEERPQGLLKIHRLPVFHEKGGGGGARSGLGDDLAFTVSRRKFVIAKFSLPPLEGDKEGQEGVMLGSAEGGVIKADLEF